MSKRQIAVRVLDWGSNAVLCLVVLAVIAVLLAPRFTGWRYGILRSGSMSPTMPTGSAIVVEPVGSRTLLHTGDVITFRSSDNPDLLVTHRIVQANAYEDGTIAYRTQGDANNAPDGWIVTPDQVVGRVIYHVPKVGLLVNSLHNKFAFFLLIGLPAALIVGMELRELVGGIKDLRHRHKEKVEA